MAPFLMSAAGVGYEQHAYVWTGFGVWTQLWAMWTLPLAWGLSWRAIRDGRGYLAAVLCTALTVALHFETGYLALSVLLIWPFVAGRPLVARLRRAAALLGGSLLASAWVIVPLLQQRNWAAVNEPVQGTGFVNGYGARVVLDWLVSGQLLDEGRLPVVTVFAALGFGLAWLAWSSAADARALLVAFAVCLLLAFGRTTFGWLVDVLPGTAIPPTTGCSGSATSSCQPDTSRRCTRGWRCAPVPTGCGRSTAPATCRPARSSARSRRTERTWASAAFRCSAPAWPTTATISA
jgi:hypothetical protein